MPSPLLWSLAAVVLVVGGAAVYLLRSAPASTTDRIRSLVTVAVDKVSPLDESRVLDRLEDEASKAGARARQRGINPGIITVYFGRDAFDCVGGDAAKPQIDATVRHALSTLNPPVDATRSRTTVRLNEDLEPGRVAVSLAPSQKAFTPSVDGSQHHGSSGDDGRGALRRSGAWRVTLTALSAGMPDLAVITDRDILVGRENCDLALPEAATALFVGRQHAELRANSRTRAVTVKDKGSTNGTFVNGARISDARLEHGDQLTLGQASWLVSVA